MPAEIADVEACCRADGQLALLPVPVVAAGGAVHAVDLAAEHGEVFTRQWVVELILDLVGYTAEQDLAVLVAVEPACGRGAFLGPLVARLSASCRRRGRTIADGADAVQAFDLLPRNIEAARRLVTRILGDDGWPQDEVHAVVPKWIQEADYLLRPPQAATADIVVGNPPYIRLEDVPETRMRTYRRSCPTMIGRSDIYVGFFDKALKSLKPDGRVGFICADRWMRNQYGRQLRGLVADGYSLDVAISMHDVDAFDTQVSAYPGVTILSRRAQQSVIVADTTAEFGGADAAELTRYTQDTTAATVKTSRYEVSRLPRWFCGESSWPSGSPARLSMIEYLTDSFPPLEDRGTRTKVGIGVATGADTVFITRDAAVAEPERLLPLAMVSDIASGRMRWSGHYLVNPWDEQGLVRLVDHPRLFAYFKKHAEVLRKRHVARRQPERWYRTIDRVAPRLTGTPKLLIPDMRMAMHPVLDEGTCYPHHNLYVITSHAWDLRVLGGLLLSRVATAFVEAFCVKMRGRTLRFQAQYLRRIRVPRIADVTPEDCTALAAAFDQRDVDAATDCALRLYRLDNLPE